MPCDAKRVWTAIASGLMEWVFFARDFESFSANVAADDGADEDPSS